MRMRDFSMRKFKYCHGEKASRKRQYMSSRDIIDFNQASVKFIKDDETIKSLTNPIYRPILLILREGIKTAEEIEEELRSKDKYKDISGKTPSLKTIYRHLKALSDVDLVIQAGVRIIDRKEEEKPPVTQKLFARTAKFFYLDSKSKKTSEPKNIQKRVKIITELFALTQKLDKSANEKLKDILTEIYSKTTKESDKLFKEFPEELAEIAGNLPLDELQLLLEDYMILKIIQQSSEFEKRLKEILKD